MKSSPLWETLMALADSMFKDYPEKLSVEEWLVFNAENEYWYNGFKDRNDAYEKKHRAEIDALVNG